MLALGIDLILTVITLGVAWRALAHRDLFVAVILFIVFGLLMSLVWVRLGAGDIALAEAALGAGLTGALLLDALQTLSPHHTRRNRSRRPPALESVLSGSFWRTTATALTTGALAACLLWVAFRLDRTAGGLTAQVTEHLERSGIEQPVTAVLLSFRGYDTLLEISVLLLAALGMLAVRQARDLSAVPQETPGDPPLVWLIRLLLPILILSGTHLLLLGTHRAGGGFQAGAVFAATAILLLLGGYPSIPSLPGLWFRGALLCGVVMFLTAGIWAMLAGGYFLQTSPALVILIEMAIAVGTASILSALFAGALPSPPLPSQDEGTQQ